MIIDKFYDFRSARCYDVFNSKYSQYANLVVIVKLGSEEATAEFPKFYWSGRKYLYEVIKYEITVVQEIFGQV